MSGGKSESSDQQQSTGSTFIDPNQAPWLQQLSQMGFNQLEQSGGDFQDNVLNPSMQTFQQLLGGGQNPHLEEQIQQGQSMINRNFTENLLPTIGGNAQGVGQLGGSRQGVAEGIALRGANEQSSNFTSQMLGDDFNRQRESQLRALGMSGGMGGLAFSPLQNLAQIIGRPTVLAENQSSGESESKSVDMGF